MSRAEPKLCWDLSLLGTNIRRKEKSWGTLLDQLLQRPQILGPTADLEQPLEILQPSHRLVVLHIEAVPEDVGHIADQHHVVTQYQLLVLLTLVYIEQQSLLYALEVAEHLFVGDLALINAVVAHVCELRAIFFEVALNYAHQFLGL